MGRQSTKVRDWSPSKGKAKGTMNVYYAIESNKDTLFDIHIGNKSWGDEWYDLVRAHCYAEAKAKLLIEGKGKSVTIAICCINDIIALENELGGDR